MEEQYKKLEEAEGGWDKLYDSINRRSRSHNWTVADKPANKKLNRYKNIKPYDHTRVKLERLADLDYVNASYLTVPRAARKYILTQGPMPETTPHFWLMVWEQKSSVIVMLNKVEGFNECEMYWPDQKNQPIKLHQVNLEVSLKDTKTNKHFCTRKFLIKDTSGDEDEETEREVIHFHFTAWPDHGSPDSPMSFLRLLAAVRKSSGLDKMDEPSIVHCSAGVGRSGTFCLIDSVLALVENQGTTEGIDIESLLIEMRDHRAGLIQSSSQLKFSYTTILYGINILEKANKLHPHMSSYNPPSTPSTLTATSTGSGSGGAPQPPIPATRFEFPPSESSLSATSATTSSAASSKGSSIAATKKPRRAAAKKKQTASTSTSTVNIFNQHLLVNALDDIDSDTADNLFYKTMMSSSSIKKARSESTEDDTDMAKTPTNLPGDMSRLIRSSVPGVGSGSSFVFPAALPRSDTPDSTILKRREREFRTKKLAEKTDEIKSRMKKEEYMRERFNKRMKFLNQVLLGAGVIGIISAATVLYLLNPPIPLFPYF